jgi:lipopolysaccharide transport system ATP-binding protein
MNLPSTNLGKDTMSGKPYPQGRFLTRCTLPKNFLNDSYYSVKVFLIRDVTHILAVVEDAVNFSVIDTGAMRKEYHGAWPGAIRPQMTWSTEQLK